MPKPKRSRRRPWPELEDSFLETLETLLQAAEYQAQGYATGPWRDTSLAAQRTEAGRQLAQAIGQADPHHWWSAFAASYAELRASTRGTPKQ